jgi:hypothetical protein
MYVSGELQNTRSGVKGEKTSRKKPSIEFRVHE